MNDQSILPSVGSADGSFFVLALHSQSGMSTSVITRDNVILRKIYAAASCVGVALRTESSAATVICPFVVVRMWMYLINPWARSIDSLRLIRAEARRRSSASSLSLSRIHRRSQLRNPRYRTLCTCYRFKQLHVNRIQSSDQAIDFTSS